MQMSPAVTLNDLGVSRMQSSRIRNLQRQFCRDQNNRGNGLREAGAGGNRKRRSRNADRQMKDRLAWGGRAAFEGRMTGRVFAR
jgi:hypothetical protein